MCRYAYVGGLDTPNRSSFLAGPSGSTGFCDGACCAGVCSPDDGSSDPSVCCASLHQLPFSSSPCVSYQQLRLQVGQWSCKVIVRAGCSSAAAQSVLPGFTAESTLRRPLRHCRVLQRQVLPRSDRHLRRQRRLGWPRNKSLLCASATAL